MKTPAIKEFFDLTRSSSFETHDTSIEYEAAYEAVEELEELAARYDNQLLKLGFSTQEQLLDTMTVLRRDQKTTDEKAFLEAVIEEHVKPNSAEISKRKNDAFWRMLAAAIYIPLHAGLTEDELIAVIRLRCERLRKEAMTAEQEKKS